MFCIYGVKELLELLKKRKGAMGSESGSLDENISLPLPPPPSPRRNLLNKPPVRGVVIRFYVYSICTSGTFKSEMLHFESNKSSDIIIRNTGKRGEKVQGRGLQVYYFVGRHACKIRFGARNMFPNTPP